MSWVKIDDNAPEHPKLLRLAELAKEGDKGAAACWLWVCGLAYCNRQRVRDGFIPALKVAQLYPVKGAAGLAARLVEVGLWELAEGGYRIHDYNEYQPTTDEAEGAREAIRQARRDAGKIGGLRSAETRAAKQLLQANGQANDEANDEANGKQLLPSKTKQIEARSKPSPVPSRPVPIPSPVSETKTMGGVTVPVGFCDRPRLLGVVAKLAGGTPPESLIAAIASIGDHANAADKAVDDTAFAVKFAETYAEWRKGFDHQPAWTGPAVEKHSLTVQKAMASASAPPDRPPMLKPEPLPQALPAAERERIRAQVAAEREADRVAKAATP